MALSAWHKINHFLSNGMAFKKDINPYPALIIFLCLLVIATAQRIYHIDYHSLWSDELWGVLACSRGSWWAMIEDLIYQDSHPPGYQTLLYFWMKFFGNSDLSVRLPSALAGIGSVVLVYTCGRRLFSRLAGLFAASLLSGSYQAIYYSKEARAYSFLILLAPASLWCFIEWFVYRNRQRHVLLLYWITTTLLIYMHYVGFVFYCSEILIFLVMFAMNPTRDNLRSGFILFAPVLLAYSPWLPVMYAHMASSPTEFSTPIPDLKTLADTARFVFAPDGFRVMFFTGWCLLGALIFTVSLWRHRTQLRATHRVVLLIIAAAFIPVAVFYIKSHIGQSVYTQRHFIYIIPFFCLLLGYMFSTILPRLRQSLLVVVMVLCLLTMFGINATYNLEYRLHSNYFNKDYRGAAEIVWRDKECRNNPQCIVVKSDTLFNHYADRLGLGEKTEFYLQTPEDLDAFHQFLAEGDAQYFYYLEIRKKEKTKRLTNLEANYEAICRSKLTHIQVFKFRRAAPVALLNEETLEDCPRSGSLRPLR